MWERTHDDVVIEEVDLTKDEGLMRKSRLLHSPFSAMIREPRTITGSAMQTYRPSPRNANSPQDINKTETNAEFLLSMQRKSPQVKVPLDFELQLPNDRSFYRKSPAARFAKENGDLSLERLHPSKQINRKIKMQDSFTRIVPGYCHQARSGFTSAASHYLHPLYKETVDRTPITHISRDFTLKKSANKEYHEDIVRLGKFGP